MEPSSPLSKFEPGVFQGTPENSRDKKSEAPRLMRTMKTDVAEAIQSQNETQVSIAVAEQKKHAQEQSSSLAARRAAAESTPAPKRISRIVLVMIALTVVALLGVAYVFLLPKLGSVKLPSVSLPSLPSFGKSTDTPLATSTVETTTPRANSIISSQEEVRFDISKQARGQIAAEIHTTLPVGDTSGRIKNLLFVEETNGVFSEILPGRFISFSGAPAPDILIRSLENSFMVGLLTEDATSTPFVVLKVSEHDLAFAGMLEWETNLPALFDNVFGSNIGAGIVPGAKFRDIVLQGKDARIITSASMESISYIFVNENTIVIAGSRSALETLIPIAGSK